jgi:hypothetical protein
MREWAIEYERRVATQRETHMTTANRKNLRRVSSLLVLGIIVTNTGYSLAADLQAARGGAEAPDNRNGPAHHRPPRGGWVGTLPPGHRPYYYRGRPLYFHDGLWYERRPRGYFIVRPPIGLYVPVRPPNYTTMWIGGVYYYANDTYYRWADSRKAYEVVGQPAGADASGVPPAPLVKDEPGQSTFVYPRNGQSAEQQSTDRYECHTWSTGQAGFDPTQAGGGVKPEENGPRSRENQRAVNACLEARGYSVK